MELLHKNGVVVKCSFLDFSYLRLGLFKLLFLFQRENALLKSFECFMVGEFMRHVFGDVHLGQEFFAYDYYSFVKVYAK